MVAWVVSLSSQSILTPHTSIAHGATFFRIFQSDSNRGQPIVLLSHSKLKRKGSEARHEGLEEPNPGSFAAAASN
jgi:hypothetical protein